MLAKNRARSREGDGTSGGETAGWWFCAHCGDLHDVPTCRMDPPTPSGTESGFTGAVHLCACCCRVPIRHTSALSSFFCGECGPRVVEVNRTAKRLVIPVCRDSRWNCALFLPPDSRLEASEVTRASRFLETQIVLLAESAAYRARFLFNALRLPWDDLLPLDTYLHRVSELRADVFQAPAALRDLLATFCPYVLGVPAEDPALAARIEEEAQRLARGVDARETRLLLVMGPAALSEAARLWAWDAIDRVLPIPPYLPADSCQVLTRRSHTVRALEAAAVRAIERVHGPAKRPSAPRRVEDLEIALPPTPGEPWPVGVAETLPRDAHLVVGLEDPPADPDMPLCVYHLSPDTPDERWILWTEVDEGDGWCESVPAAWCRRRGLPAAEAAFLLLEALLARDRDAHDGETPRPTVAMPGILGRDLADVLLDRIWKAEQG